MANKNARILWAVMTKGEAFDARHVSVTRHFLIQYEQLALSKKKV